MLVMRPTEFVWNFFLRLKLFIYLVFSILRRALMALWRNNLNPTYATFPVVASFILKEFPF